MIADFDLNVYGVAISDLNLIEVCIILNGGNLLAKEPGCGRQENLSPYGTGGDEEASCMPSDFDITQLPA